MSTETAIVERPQSLEQLALRERELDEKVKANAATAPEILELDQVRAQIKAVKQAEAAARSRAQRDALHARAAEFETERERRMRRIGTLVPQLMLELAGLKRLTVNPVVIPRPGQMTPQTEEIFGVPHDFADKLLGAIADAAPNTEWDFSGAGDPPKLKPVRTVTINAGPGKPPPGWSGIWPPPRKPAA